jgi:threonyl-tRNA synthetase
MHGLLNKLRANMVRVDTDFSATPFKAKISNAEQLRVHTMLVIGGRDPAVRDRRGERPSPRQRPARREAEGGSRGGDSCRYSRTKGLTFRC